MEELFTVSPEQKTEIETLISEGTTLSTRPVSDSEKAQFYDKVSLWSKHVTDFLQRIEKELVIMFDSTFGKVSVQDDADSIKGQVFLGVTFLESLIEDWLPTTDNNHEFHELYKSVLNRFSVGFAEKSDKSNQIYQILGARYYADFFKHQNRIILRNNTVKIWLFW